MALPRDIAGRAAKSANAGWMFWVPDMPFFQFSENWLPTCLPLHRPLARGGLGYAQGSPLLLADKGRGEGY